MAAVFTMRPEVSRAELQGTPAWKQITLRAGAHARVRRVRPSLHNSPRCLGCPLMIGRVARRWHTTATFVWMRATQEESALRLLFFSASFSVQPGLEVHVADRRGLKPEPEIRSLAFIECDCTSLSSAPIFSLLNMSNPIPPDFSACNSSDLVSCILITG